MKKGTLGEAVCTVVNSLNAGPGPLSWNLLLLLVRPGQVPVSQFPYPQNDNVIIYLPP